MMTADEIFHAIQSLPDDERRQLLARVAHELGEAPPASASQGRRPADADRRAAVGMDEGKIWIAEDFDGPLPEDLQRAFEGEGDDP
jgi:hypothetical protein